MKYTKYQKENKEPTWQDKYDEAQRRGVVLVVDWGGKGLLVDSQGLSASNRNDSKLYVLGCFGRLVGEITRTDPIKDHQYKIVGELDLTPELLIN